jgi:hypothetical protein
MWRIRVISSEISTTTRSARMMSVLPPPYGSNIELPLATQPDTRQVSKVRPKATGQISLDYMNFIDRAECNFYLLRHSAECQRSHGSAAEPQSDVPAACSAWGGEKVGRNISNEKRKIGKYNKNKRKKGPSCKEHCYHPHFPVPSMPCLLILMLCPVAGKWELSPSVLTHPWCHFARFATLDQFAG